MLSIAYLALLIFIIFSEVLRKKTGKFDFLTLGNVMFVLAYVLPGFLLEANIDHSAEILNNGDSYVGQPQTIVAVFVGYLFLFFGFYSHSAVKAANNCLIKAARLGYVALYAICLLMISSIAIYIYGSQYGGILNAIANITLIRSNADVDSGSFVFVKHFMYCSMFASYLLASFAFPPANTQQHQKLKKVFLALFIVSVVVAFIASSLSGGRAVLIYYFLGFYLVYVLRGGLTLNLATIPIVLFSGLFLFYGKELFWSLSALPDGLDAVAARFIEAKESGAKTEFNIYELFANFAFPVQSLNAAFHYADFYEKRLFVDWIYAVISFVPEKIFGIQKPDTVSILNTQLILDLAVGVRSPGLGFEIPTGFLAFGVYSFSWLGLLIVTYLYGWVGRYLQTALIQSVDSISWVPFIYALTLQVWIDFQQSGDPRVFLVANFWYFLSLVFLLVIGTRISMFQPRSTPLS